MDYFRTGPLNRASAVFQISLFASVRKKETAIMNSSKKQQQVRYCRNCGQKIIGYRDEDGMLRLKCPRCNAVSVSRKVTRRHEDVQEYAPPGQVII